MLSQESETVELKVIIVEDIKRESLHLRIARVESYNMETVK